MGPLFWHEMRVLARRKRYFFLRVALLLVLGGLSLVAYRTIESEVRQEASFALVIGGQVHVGNPQQQLSAALISRALVRYGERVVWLYFWVAGGLAVVLAPLLVVAGVTEERQRGTMDLLLSSALRPWEVILGKTLPRVLMLAVVVLGGLGVPALSVLVGGVNFHLLLGSTLVVLSMLLSLAALGALLASRGWSTGAALLTCYVWTLSWVGMGWYGVGRFPGLAWVNAAGYYEELARLAKVQGDLSRWSWQFGAVHALVHLALAGLLFGGAAYYLRRGQERAAIVRPRGRRLACRPRFDPQWPLLWKEQGVRWRRSWFLWLLLAGLSLFAAATGFINLRVYLAEKYLGSRGWRWNWNAYEEVGTYISWLIYVGGGLALLGPTVVIACRTAWSVRSESDRGTWETLLTLPIPLRSILRAKWWGGIVAALPVLTAALVVLMGLPLVAWFATSDGPRHLIDTELFGTELVLGTVVLGVPGITASLAAFSASLGLFMSVLSRSALRAVVGTVVVLAAFLVLPFLVARWLGVRFSTDLIAGLIDAIELAILSGLPVAGVFILAIFSRRLRRWLDEIWRLLALPVLIGIILQGPLLLAVMVISALDESLFNLPFLSLLSPLGYLDYVNRLIQPFPVILDWSTNTQVLVFVVFLYSFLAYVLWVMTCVVAARREGRLEDRRRLPRTGLARRFRFFPQLSSLHQSWQQEA